MGTVSSYKFNHVGSHCFCTQRRLFETTHCSQLIHCMMLNGVIMLVGFAYRLHFYLLGF